MKIDHIGYAVKDIDKAKKPMEEIGFVFEETVQDTERNIYIAFGGMDGYRVELVAPVSEGSPVDMYLGKVGPTPYHICYKSADIVNDIGRLKKKQFRITKPLSSAMAFGGKRVAFLYSLSAGLIEIVEE